MKFTLYPDWGTSCPVERPSDLQTYAALQDEKKMIWAISTLLAIDKEKAYSIIAKCLMSLAKENKELWLKVVKPSGDEQMNR